MSLRGQIFGTTIHTRDEIGLVRPRSVTSISRVEGTTSHYAGPSDWRQKGIDRSSPARFRDTTDHARCAAIMRAHQAFHMGPQRGWSDYAYSGAFCPHGYGYLGRGRGVRTAANGTSDGNDRSYALQYMGAGPDDPLTIEAKRAAIDMAAYLGEPLRWEHSDWKPTACSGPQIRPWRRAGFPRPAGGATPTPASPPAITPIEEDDMPTATVWRIDKELWLCDGLTRRRLHSQEDVNHAVLVGWAKPGDKHHPNHIRDISKNAVLRRLVLDTPEVHSALATALVTIDGTKTALSKGGVLRDVALGIAREARDG